jgi:hypothetical protein
VGGGEEDEWSVEGEGEEEEDRGQGKEKNRKKEKAKTNERAPLEKKKSTSAFDSSIPSRYPQPALIENAHHVIFLLQSTNLPSPSPLLFSGYWGEGASTSFIFCSVLFTFSLYFS